MATRGVVMKAAASLLVLTLCGTTAALVIVYVARQSLSIDEPRLEESSSSAATAPSATASVQTEPVRVPVIAPVPAWVEQPAHKTQQVEKVEKTEKVVVGEVRRKEMRDHAAKETQHYSLLLDDLDLTAQQRQALVSLLIELSLEGSTSYSFAGTKATLESQARSISKQERSQRLAAAIGDAKRDQFLELERNLNEYAEAQRVGFGLQSNGTPLSDTQRHGFLKVLIGAKEAYLDAPPMQAKPGSIESLDASINRLNEYERHVLELAPSVLSSGQIEYLFDQYQKRWEGRARAVEVQEKRRLDHPGQNFPLWYPGL